MCAPRRAMPDPNTYNAIFHIFIFALSISFHSSSSNVRTSQRKIKRQSGFTVNFYDHIALKKKKKNVELFYSFCFSRMLALIRWLALQSSAYRKRREKNYVKYIENQFTTQRHMLRHDTFRVLHSRSPWRRCIAYCSRLGLGYPHLNERQKKE